MNHKHVNPHLKWIAQSAGAVEYTNCFSAEGYDPTSTSDTKQSNGEVPVMLGIWGMRITLHCYHSQVHSGPEWYHLIGPYLCQNELLELELF